MRQPHVDDWVRLTHDVPWLALCRGDLGVVRSTWFAPTNAYEVEFHHQQPDEEARAILLEDQVELEEKPVPGSVCPVA